MKLMSKDAFLRLTVHLVKMFGSFVRARIINFANANGLKALARLLLSSKQMFSLSISIPQLN